MATGTTIYQAQMQDYYFFGFSSNFSAKARYRRIRAE
jgi:hypothetical protein